MSDVQVHNYKKFDQKGSRLRNCLNVIEDIFKFNHKNKIKYTLFGGDLYDSQKNLPTEVVNETIATFKKMFEQYPEQVWLAISGNHDHATKNLIDKPAITALTHLSEVFRDKFLLIDNMRYSIPGVDVIGIPYYEYKEHFKKRLEDSIECLGDKIRPEILMIHQTPKHSNPFIPYDTDPEDPIYERFDYVLCGHIHKREDITENFSLIGSPLHRDLSDEGQEKGFLVFDTDNLKAGYKFIHLKKYPVYKTSSNPNPDDTDYVIPIIDIEEEEDQSFETKKFTVSNSHSDLVKNYWESVGGGDKQLLELGLKFIS